MLVADDELTVQAIRRQERKYACRNPLQQWALRRFFARIRGWLDRTKPNRVLDLGCGEGLFWQRMAATGPLPEVVGVDLRSAAVEAAQRRLPTLRFHVGDFYEFVPDGDGFDMVLACEVLEHLPDPRRALERICAMTNHHVLLTVPHEPYFQICNFLRGRDLARFGNHPEHVQHWGQKSFRAFLSDFLGVDDFAAEFPFLMALGTKK